LSIEIRNVSKRFGSFQALDNVSLHVDSGDLIALLGPSGCGKTTLLRIIAGLEAADAGDILFSGTDATHVHVSDRQVGFVFQHYALFRHMTVFENVAFGLRVRPRAQRPAEAEIRRRVLELLGLVQLDWLADRYPSQLSGGQRQRIALARALAVEPKVLLLDEPFGALDAKVRKELRRWLRRLHDELHVTSIFVTHDQEEALEVSDRVVVMNRGVIEQTGSPQQVWREPISPFVYGFLGDVNLFRGQVRDGIFHLQNARLPAPDMDRFGDKPASAYVRPHDIELTPAAQMRPGIAVQLERAVVIGPVARLELRPLDAEGMPDLIEAQMTSHQFDTHNFREGEALTAVLRHGRVFAPEHSPKV